MTMSPPSAGRRPLSALLAANLISQIGKTFSYLAIPWFVLITTGSASRTDYAEAAAVILARDGHQNENYEFSCDVA